MGFEGMFGDGRQQGGMEAAIAQMMQQRVPYRQGIDPVTPYLLEELVKRSLDFSFSIVSAIISDKKDEEEYVANLYDICFSRLRPFPTSLLTLDAARNIFFNLYFAQNHGAVFDYVISVNKDYGDGNYEGHVVSEKGIVAFAKAYDNLTEQIYNHFVKEKKASRIAFNNMLQTFFSTIRD